jgi:cytoskeletal protein CcmA (bactofilin family)
MLDFRPEQKNVMYVGEGVTMKGAIQAQEIVVVDGTVEGEIICGQLIVGASGVVNGTITVSDADVHGKIGTEVSVKQLLLIRSTGRVEGKWVYGEIAVEKGGVLSGSGESTGFSRAERKGEAPASPAASKPELVVAAAANDQIDSGRRSPAARAFRDRKRFS